MYVSVDFHLDLYIYLYVDLYFVKYVDFHVGFHIDLHVTSQFITDNVLLRRRWSALAITDHVI